MYGAVPIMLAAMGGILSERAGVVNIALEGMILTGAFFGAWAGQHSAIAGLASALAAGGFLGILHALLTQKTQMNHVVSGLGINLLAAGATRYLSIVYFAGGITSQEINPRVYVCTAVISPFAIAFLLGKTRFGLRLRAVGENPESVRMSGIAVVPIRILAVTLSGVFAALAGTFLSLGESQTFSRDMSAGKGYIALAAVIFGKWNPAGATFAALFFGLFYAIQTQMQISGIHLGWFGTEWSSPFLLDALPYLMAIAALVSVVGRAVPPASLGKEDA
jgi:simple sugar transport system permease protein